MDGSGKGVIRPEVGTGLGDSMTLFHTHPFTPFQTPEELDRLLGGSPYNFLSKVLTVFSVRCGRESAILFIHGH